MKITRLETELYIAPPPERPITDALRANRHPGRVHVKIHTDKGLVGSSSTGFLVDSGGKPDAPDYA